MFCLCYRIQLVQSWTPWLIGFADKCGIHILAFIFYVVSWVLRLLVAVDNNGKWYLICILSNINRKDIQTDVLERFDQTSKIVNILVTLNSVVCRWLDTFGETCELLDSSELLNSNNMCCWVLNNKILQRHSHKLILATEFAMKKHSSYI